MSEQICGKCRMPIHPSETGLRHFGHFTAHREDRCIYILQDTLATAERELAELRREVEPYRKALEQIASGTRDDEPPYRAFPHDQPKKIAIAVLKPQTTTTPHEVNHEPELG